MRIAKGLAFQRLGMSPSISTHLSHHSSEGGGNPPVYPFKKGGEIGTFKRSFAGQIFIHLRRVIASFRTSKKFTNELIFTEKHKEGPKLMSELPRAFVEKLKGLNFDIIKGVVGEYLTDEEINAVLIRRDLILKEIDRLIQKNGEAQVLY